MILTLGQDDELVEVIMGAGAAINIVDAAEVVFESQGHRDIGVTAVTFEDRHVDQVGSIVQDVCQLTIEQVVVGVVERDGEARILAKGGTSDAAVCIANKANPRIGVGNGVAEVVGDDATGVSVAIITAGGVKDDHIGGLHAGSHQAVEQADHRLGDSIDDVIVGIAVVVVAVAVIEVDLDGDLLTGLIAAWLNALEDHLPYIAPGSLVGEAFETFEGHGIDHALVYDTAAVKRILTIPVGCIGVSNVDDTSLQRTRRPGGRSGGR